MLGRNIDEEYGIPGRASPAYSMSSQENEAMNQATRCVRKFAPEGRRKMRRTDNGHITACKISDANPNEMIASWSGDHIYGFDLIRSADSRDKSSQTGEGFTNGRGKGKVRESGDRKRKRKKEYSASGRRSSKPRHGKERAEGDGDLALRVRYENGQTEDIAMDEAVPSLPASMVEEARESVLNEAQKRSLQIAKSLVKIRKLMFSLEVSSQSSDLSHHIPTFTAALGLAATCISEMDEIIRSWRYPVDPLPEDVMLQQTLRRNRNSSRRFVQAAGTLARMLGGKIQTASRTPSPALDLFQEIVPAPDEGSEPPDREMFSYDFLKAIILWLEGGPQALLQGFKRPPNQRRDNPRFPVPDHAELSAIDECIIPYLLNLARNGAIPDIDASRFLKDENRKIYETETAAVIAFGAAVKMPLQDLPRAVVAGPGSEGDGPGQFLQDKETARRYWGFMVGRGLLMNAGEGLNFQFVDTAFGGLGTIQVEAGKVQKDVDSDEEEDLVDEISLLQRPSHSLEPDTNEASETRHIGEDSAIDEAHTPSVQHEESDIDIEDAGSDAEVILMDDLHDEIAEHMAAEDDEDDYDDENNQDGDDSDADDDDDGEITAEERHFMFQSASDRGKLREKVEKNVPCYSHTRKYTGHCNVKTVKDANFFGLQDEYVVSGSDGGHLFIWDKKTSELVNILEGDNEVVNVVQGKPSYPKLNGISSLTIRSLGHPYEPLLAVSGIDHTIKIFSPDSRAQEDAEKGTNISSAVHGSSGYSSLSGRRRPRRNSPAEEEPSQQEGLASRKRMQQSYQIISQNDVQRQGGMRDAYITVRADGPFVRLRMQVATMGFADWLRLYD